MLFECRPVDQFLGCVRLIFEIFCILVFRIHIYNNIHHDFIYIDHFVQSSPIPFTSFYTRVTPSFSLIILKCLNNHLHDAEAFKIILQPSQCVIHRCIYACNSLQ